MDPNTPNKYSQAGIDLIGDPSLLLSEGIYPITFKIHFFETRNRISRTLLMRWFKRFKA